MLTNRQISTTALAGLCRRMATALTAGLDVRRVVEREAGAARGRLAAKLGRVRTEIDRGGELAAGMRATDGFFPPLVCEMVAVGEKTGQLAEVFRQLAEHLEFRRELRREFLWSIARPAVQLLAAIFVVGFLIVFMGVVAQTSGQRVDMLGFGLSGASGLARYLVILSLVFVTALVLVQAVRLALQKSATVQRLARALPIVGPAMRAQANARFCWTLGLTLDSAMDLRRGLALALASTDSALFQNAEEPIWRRIASGGTLHDGLTAARLFPVDLLNEIDVGEQSGRLSQTLVTMARLYQADARSAMRGVAVVAGWLIWLLVAALLIFLIFRLASFYFGSFSSLV